MIGNAQSSVEKFTYPKGQHLHKVLYKIDIKRLNILRSSCPTDIHTGQKSSQTVKGPYECNGDVSGSLRKPISDIVVCVTMF